MLIGQLEFIPKHRDGASNEEHPNQGVVILKKVAQRIKSHPAEFNVSSKKDIKGAVGKCNFLAVVQVVPLNANAALKATSA